MWRNLFKRKYPGTGAVLDDRPQAEREKDYKLIELVSSIAPVTWVEKKPSEWRKFPIFNQDGSGSCVAQTLSKLMGILYWLKNGVYVHFSATHIYQRRANKPQGGMAGIDAFTIAQQGVTLEVLAPSQNLTDAQMDGYKIDEYKVDVGKVFKLPKYVVLPIKDIDTVASTIEKTKKGVMVWFYFEYREWTDVPSIMNSSLDIIGPSTVRHSVTAVDYTLYNGKKALIIEDSWGQQYGLGGQRVITEDFFKARNFFAAYPLNFVFEEQVTPKPTHLFTKTLYFSPEFSTDEDVKALQNILKYEGLFPTNVDSSGYFGSVTAKAVLEFQKKYKVASDAELDQLAGKVVGPKTITKLNELYGHQ